jgi:hypothetical protein
MKVVLRAYHPQADNAFIYATWTKNVWHRIKKSSSVEKKKWFELKIKEIKDSLGKYHVSIACLQEDADFIVGYALHEGSVPLWMYVKKAYRNQGVEELLSPKEKRNAEET